MRRNRYNDISKDIIKEYDDIGIVEVWKNAHKRVTDSLYSYIEYKIYYLCERNKKSLALYYKDGWPGYYNQSYLKDVTNKIEQETDMYINDLLLILGDVMEVEVRIACMIDNHGDSMFKLAELGYYNDASNLNDLNFSNLSRLRRHFERLESSINDFRWLHYIKMENNKKRHQGYKLCETVSTYTKGISTKYVGTVVFRPDTGEMNEAK